ncbi:hypothetical protein NIES4073_12500 [Kalymmatonema gypsitolerans NIES-4073]|nr:hypothetical protein NIES4073_12500 [Scytonema sp. NIES-4073]
MNYKFICVHPPHSPLQERSHKECGETEKAGGFPNLGDCVSLSETLSPKGTRFALAQPVRRTYANALGVP